MKLLLALGCMLLTAVAATAQTTITFDPLPAGSPPGSVRIGGYTEGGIVFSANPEPGSTLRGDGAGVPSNGTAFLLKCGICRPSLRSVGGGLFDLLSLDLGEPLFFGFGPFATAVTIRGFKRDGQEVIAQITTDGLAGFEPIVLDAAFSDLVSAEISTVSPYLNIAIDNLLVLVGLEKPTLALSPASGTYVTIQAFDLTLIVVGEGSDSAVIADATLDGLDFAGALEACVALGSLEAGSGVTFRCPLDLADLGAGPHTFEATIELDNGTTASDGVSWEILESQEP